MVVVQVLMDALVGGIYFTIGIFVYDDGMAEAIASDSVRLSSCGVRQGLHEASLG